MNNKNISQFITIAIHCESFRQAYHRLLVDPQDVLRIDDKVNAAVVVLEKFHKVLVYDRFFITVEDVLVDDPLRLAEHHSSLSAAKHTKTSYNSFINNILTSQLQVNE